MNAITTVSMLYIGYDKITTTIDMSVLEENRAEADIKFSN